MKQGPPDLLNEDLVMAWFCQLLSAVDYIHGKKILHRDLKTSNIFLAGGPATGGTIQDRCMKLGDFGISRVLDGTREAAVTVVGTPYYMSPEVCRSEPYNWKSDVWALGWRIPVPAVRSRWSSVRNARSFL